MATEVRWKSIMITRLLVHGFRLLRDFDWKACDEGLNILVGDNGAGKSTVLDAIELCLTGRLHGRRALDELNPYWFNVDDVSEFYKAVKTEDANVTPPKIIIEAYLNCEEGPIAKLRGVNNLEGVDCPGLRLEIRPIEDLRVDLVKRVQEDAKKGATQLLPTEFYEIVWTSFQGGQVRRTPDGVSCIRISADGTRRGQTADFYARSLIQEMLSDASIRGISLKYRDTKREIDEAIAAAVAEDDIEGLSNVGFQMDQSARSNWLDSVILKSERVPLAMEGDGRQVEAKVGLALARSGEKKILLMEEPEARLSHTSLTKMLSRIIASLDNRQMFATTHSAFVLNRLGLNRLALVSEGKSPTRLTELDQETVSYFKRQSGYDTLRVVLANRLVIVEGPTDEMVFDWAYRKEFCQDPADGGIDVMSYGTRGKRALELAAAVGRSNLLVLRDNDHKPPEKWINDAKEYLATGRELIVGDEAGGSTIEPQMVSANMTNLSLLAKTIGCNSSDKDEMVDYMTEHKTDWALKLLEADASTADKLNAPPYINRAVRFISQQRTLEAKG
jgi:predicted ATPase